ncbi:hypothetical protein GCM10010099_13100 [Streptomyces cinereus]|nr:hypothetical protein GCM10010099_13100 [Streptomyces cinereus]
MVTKFEGIKAHRIFWDSRKEGVIDHYRKKHIFVQSLTTVSSLYGQAVDSR